MIRIANLEFDPTALEYVPELLAREECVLPLGLEGDALRVALGRRDDYRDSRRKLRFITDRRLFWCVADREQLERVIDEVYSLRETEVTNCPIGSYSVINEDYTFRETEVTSCPRWLELQPGTSPDVRFCETCNRKVYLCTSQKEAVEHAGLARRIAIYKAPDNWNSVDS